MADISRPANLDVEAEERHPGEAMLMANGGGKTPSFQMKPVRLERRQQYPCSPGQKRMWVLDQLEPENPALQLATRWRLEGNVNVAHLERAFQLVVARHEALRASFSEIDGEPMQYVEPYVPFRIKVVELVPLLETRAGAEAERLARLEARAPFHLRLAPPFIRATVLRIADDASLLLLTAHQIVCDVWSIELIAREIGESYSALPVGRLPQLPELPFSYGEFCVSQLAEADQEWIKSEETFWEQRLSGAKHFELPCDKPRPPVLTSGSDTFSLSLEDRLVEDVSELGRQNGSTLFTTTLAVLLVLLHRYTSETDICVGTQIARRGRSDVRDLIGTFVNTLVLRNDLSGDLAFSDVLMQVRNTVKESFAHSGVPLEKLIEILRPQRDRSRNPLFSVNYAIRESFIDSVAGAGLRIIDVQSVSTGAMYEVNILLVKRHDGWHLSCEYNTDLYESRTVSRLLVHFRNLLCAVIGDPTCRISALPILDDDERRTILIDWNRTAICQPPHRSVSQLFEAQAARTPDAVALVCGDATLTYRQLNLESDRLARRLKKRVRGRNQCIGVLLDRTVYLVAALLAVHKAGFAYVPLDPRNPTERLKHIVADAGLAGLLTDREPDLELQLDSVAIILLDDNAAADEMSPISLDDIQEPDDLAYVIYTSGSTGKPKGVEITQLSLVNLLLAMISRPGLAQNDVLLAVTTVSFDIAALELFLPLLVGARIMLATEEDVTDGLRMNLLIERYGVTVMQATPSGWRLLLEAGFHSRPAFRMLIGGESLKRDLANRLLEGGGELWNMYGPTETTIWSSCTRIEPGTGSITVGGPIDNTQFYVLDESETPVPVGVSGMLCIGGLGVARRYHNKPQLTAEKFITNRFGEGRIYLTGDLARWDPDGRIQILGRIDHQIKLRGFRIEPGEIEAALISHPDIAEAVVVLGTEGNGEGALWAYVVPKKGQSNTGGAVIAELRVSLAESLPGYMCPASITLLDAMPLTSSGKIDRLSLPRPKLVQTGVEYDLQPMTDVERRLTEIWSTVLGVPVTDKLANFFEIGGHSLLAIRLLARIDAEFGRRFSLATLFKAPRLIEQAELLNRNDTRDYDFRQVVQLQAGGTKQALIAINNTGIYYTLSKRLGSDRPFTTLQLFDPSLPAESLPTSFEDIAAGYVHLIRRIQPEGPYALLGWCIAGSLAFEIAQQLCRSGQQVSQLILVDTYVPGYLSRLSPLRRILANYSHRWQLIALDWSRVRSKRQGLSVFLGNRAIVKRMLTFIGRLPADAELVRNVHGRAPAPDVYDQWLLNYLLEAAERYEPRRYSGKITIFRSAEEPGGRFLDFKMGWGAFAGGGVDVIEIEGDHFIMFQDPSVTRMAQRISAALDG